MGPSLEEVRAVAHRLFIGRPDAGLRKEDEQKCLELAALLARLSRLRSGLHLVDAAAGKASVGLVAAELLPVGTLTVIERDPRRVAACRAACGRLTRAVRVDLREADVVDPEAWPDGGDVVVALHACGSAADAIIDRAAVTGVSRIFLVPCCYGDAIPFAAGARAAVDALGYVADDLVHRRMRSALVDLERKLRLEAAGYETELDELVGATVTPHNVLFHGRRTDNPVRVARARGRLAALTGASR